jgi:hypothetical protein
VKEEPRPDPKGRGQDRGWAREPISKRESNTAWLGGKRIAREGEVNGTGPYFASLLYFPVRSLLCYMFAGTETYSWECKRKF